MRISQDICSNPFFQKAMLNTTNLIILVLDKNGKVAFINDSGARLLGYKADEMIGRDWFEYFLPDNIRSSIYKAFKNIIGGKIKRFRTYQNDVITKSNERKTIHFTNSIVREGKKIIGTLSVGIDITDYAKSKDELVRIEKINEVIINTSFKLNKADEIDEIADLILIAAKKLTDSKYGYVGYIDEETGYFYIPRFSKEIKKECRMENKNVLFTEYRGLWGWSIKNKKVLISNDVANDKRATGIPKGHIKIEKFLAIPVIKNDKVIGQIAVANSTRDYNEQDIEVLNRLVYLYSLALERVKAKERLNELLRKFYVSVEASEQIVYVYNLNTKRIVFEGNTESLVGYKKDELPKSIEGLLKLVHPEDRENLINISTNSKDYISAQFRFRKKDGEYIYAQIKGFTVRDKKSREEIRYGMVSDVSERVKFEAEIIKREEEIRSIFENVPIPMAVMDRFRNVIFVNKYFINLYGYEKKDLMDFDRWVNVAFPDATQEEVNKYSEIVFINEDEIDERHNIVFKMIAKNGDRFYVKFYKKHIGKNIVLILENVTEERLKQKRINIINQLLKVNTEINRGIININESNGVIKYAIDKLSDLNYFDNVCAFSFVEQNFRKLVRIDKKDIQEIKSENIPLCVHQCINSSESLIFKRESELCFDCEFCNHEGDRVVIVLPLRENFAFFGCLILIVKEDVVFEEEGLKIIEGIAKDISLKLNTIVLQEQNKEYLNRIKSLARFPTESPNPILRIQRDGILQYANLAADAILNEWEMAIGSPIPEFIKNDIEYVFQTDERLEREYNIKDKVYYAYIVPFIDVGYANIYFVDITEKKRQERALKESEERLRQILDIAPFGVYIVNPDYEIIYLNPYVKKELGEVGGRKCYEFFNGLDSPCEFCQMDKVKNGEIVRRVFEAPRTKKIYELVDIPYKTPDGRINKLQIYNDITELKKAEIKIRESEERFRKLFNEAPVGYYLQDENGIFIDGNPVAEKLVGCSREELIGKNFLDVGLIPEDRLAQVAEIFNRSILNGDSGPFEQEIIRKDGSRVTLELFVKYIELGGKRVVLGIASDITDRKRLENEIIRTNNELKRLSEHLKEEVDRQTEESRKREQMAIMIKNIVVSATNLVSEEEILREASYYIGEYMGYKAYGYYIASEGDLNVNLFINNVFDISDTEYQFLKEVFLKNIAKSYFGITKPKIISKEEFNFKFETPDIFKKIDFDMIFIPIVYKGMSFGFILFFLQDNQGINDIVLDALEQVSIQLGAIIEQKRTEVAKTRLNKLYESVLSSAGDGIIGTDENLNVTFINSAAVRILGYKDRDIIGTNVHRLLHSDINGEYHKIDECPFQMSLLLGERIEKVDAIFIKSDGGKIYVNKIVTPIIENEKVTGIVIAFRDITDEKRKQEEINRLATALGQYPVAIGFIDKDGNIKYVNDAFVKHTGIPREELSSMNIEDLNKGITSLIRSSPQETIYRQYNFVRRDGSKCIEFLTIAPIFSSNAEVSDYVAIKEDITSHIEIQEAHKLAREEAERASLAKTAFLATISHEMRTPLTGIDGYIRELAVTDLNEKQTELIRKARTNVEQLISIINDVLDYSKIESGKMEIENRGFDLLESLERVNSIISIKMEEKKLDFKFEIAPNVHRYVRGDNKRLEQVLINLLSNAAKFTYEGSVSVKVEERERMNGKVVLYFSVKDTGIGIKDEDKIKIFEPFSQADSSISRRFGGTGLGLAISKYFVEKMGGDIWVDSEFGKGSNFQFTVLFEIITPDKVEVEEKFIPPPLMLKGARVLLVEDNEMNQELISNLLKKYGAVVEYADNGRRAVDIIFSKPPDYYNFVLMDIQMPIMDGKTATKIIYENESYKNLPIIAMTAHAFKDEIDDMLKIGMRAHIPKPFTESYALKVMSKFYINNENSFIVCKREKEIELPDYFRELKCVDIREGLSRLSNDVESYRKMLKNFVNKYRNIGDEVSKLIDEKRYKDAEMIIHTIKGVSGNLSIKGLYEKSITFDNLLKNEPIESKIREEFKAFLNELKTVVDEIDKIPNIEEREMKLVNEDEFKSNLLKLRESLKMGDVESLDIFISIEGNLISEIGKDNVDKMRTLIENFAYKEALELLNSLCRLN